MTFVLWSILGAHGKPEAHIAAGGEQAKAMIATFERLMGRPLRAPVYDSVSGCWIAEASRTYAPTNDLGDTSFLVRQDVRAPSAR